jgi:hypothetical protein
VPTLPLALRDLEHHVLAGRHVAPNQVVVQRFVPWVTMRLAGELKPEERAIKARARCEVGRPNLQAGQSRRARTIALLGVGAR